MLGIFWAGVNTAIKLRCGPNNGTETQPKRWSRSASKPTLVRFNGWTNEWMTLSTRVVLFTISGSLAIRAVWKGIWCEYTLTWLITDQKFLTIKIFFQYKFLMLTKVEFFTKNKVKQKYWEILLTVFCLIYFQMYFIPVMVKLNFPMITWSSRNHSRWFLMVYNI